MRIALATFTYCLIATASHASIFTDLVSDSSPWKRALLRCNPHMSCTLETVWLSYKKDPKNFQELSQIIRKRSKKEHTKFKSEILKKCSNGYKWLKKAHRRKMDRLCASNNLDGVLVLLTEVEKSKCNISRQELRLQFSKIGNSVWQASNTNGMMCSTTKNYKIEKTSARKFKLTVLKVDVSGESAICKNIDKSMPQKEMLRTQNDGTVSLERCEYFELTKLY